MKQFYVALILLCVSFATHAKIWRVDNRPGQMADFTDLQPAHDAASAGDTIMVSGSPTTYSGISFTKMLVCIGPGYLLSQNYAELPNRHSAFISPSYGNVLFSAGSAGTSFIGFSSEGQDSRINVRANGIKIERCRGFLVTFEAGANDFLLTSCYQIRIDNSAAVSGGVIRNSLIQQVRIHENTIAVITNNIITSPIVTVSLQNQSINGNILLHALSVEFSGSSMSNNIDARTGGGTAFGSGNGNLGNVDPNTLFVGLAGNSEDGQWKLKAASPAKGVGQGGTDCGIYGGITPYVLSGLPPIPVITKIINSGSGSNTVPLNLKISVKSNN